MPPPKHKLNKKKPGTVKKKAVTDTVQNRNPVPASKSNVITPSVETAFKSLLSARFCASIWSHISDCDETFNYWEPLHYVVNGQGMQTWEYSPEFALRSYTYLLVHGVPAWIYKQLFNPSPILIFYFIRCMLALICALIEVYFYKAICREFGIHIGRMWLIIQLFSAGMFIASTAFLPSSFSMYLGTAALAAWWHQQYKLSIFFTAISAFLGWPFAALIGIPIAYDIIARQKKIRLFVIWAVISTVTILIPMIVTDSMYFGKLVIAPMNLVLYNVFTSHGPDLYGVEPPSYYLINGFLNYNIIWILALATPAMLVVTYYVVPSKSKSTLYLPHYLSLAPLYLWLVVFTLQPHKEERFLFPIYPMIPLCGAITIDLIQKLFYRFENWRKNIETKTHYLDSTIFIAALCMILSINFGLSRIYSLYTNYHGPLDLMTEFSRHVNSTGDMGPSPTNSTITNLCIGKDWYRFPNSFFMPSNNYKLRFVQSEFNGILPAYYSPDPANSTKIVHPYFNDVNQANPFMYFNISECNYLLDLDLGKNSTLEPNYSAISDEWQIIKSIQFLNQERSNKLLRSFFMPILSKRYSTFADFNLLQRIK